MKNQISHRDPASVAALHQSLDSCSIQHFFLDALEAIPKEHRRFVYESAPEKLKCKWRRWTSNVEEVFPFDRFDADRQIRFYAAVNGLIPSPNCRRSELQLSEKSRRKNDAHHCRNRSRIKPN